MRDLVSVKEGCVVWAILGDHPNIKTFPSLYPITIIYVILLSTKAICGIHVVKINTTRYLKHIPLSIPFINLLKPTGHVMLQQFNIQQLCALPSLYLCVLYLSENKQRILPLTA